MGRPRGKPRKPREPFKHWRSPEMEWDLRRQQCQAQLQDRWHHSRQGRTDWEGKHPLLELYEELQDAMTYLKVHNRCGLPHHHPPEAALMERALWSMLVAVSDQLTVMQNRGVNLESWSAKAKRKLPMDLFGDKPPDPIEKTPGVKVR